MLQKVRQRITVKGNYKDFTNNKNILKSMFAIIVLKMWEA